VPAAKVPRAGVAEGRAATVPSGWRRYTVIPAMDHVLPGKVGLAATLRV